jgi:hypothetical protein
MDDGQAGRRIAQEIESNLGQYLVSIDASAGTIGKPMA